MEEHDEKMINESREIWDTHSLAIIESNQRRS